jgi:AdoMet-dependent rRNA methyltransferase SPB1
MTSTQPVVMLGEYNQFTHDDTEAAKYLAMDPKFEAEIKLLCDDLRVLGKSDFKLLLKWRLRVKAAMQDEMATGESEGDDDSDDGSGTDSEDEEKAEQDMYHEMKDIKQRAAARAKREKKKLKLRRMKAKARQIMGGESSVDIVDDVELFRLKEVRGRGAVNKLVDDQVRRSNRPGTRLRPQSVSRRISDRSLATAGDRLTGCVGYVCV